MDFARKLLTKYGWKEGDGLGKKNDGIAKPLKPKLKFDNAGFGADQAASDFNNHWWERVFNEAAQNLHVERQVNGTVGVELKDKANGVEVTTKGYSLKKMKRAKEGGGCGRSDAHYDNFLQSATLTKGGDVVENIDKIAVSDIAVMQVKMLTDEELFQACRGRTAHKGARHGLKLSGKLARLEQQEKEMLAKMLQNKNDVEEEKRMKTKKNKSLETAPAFEKAAEKTEIHEIPRKKKSTEQMEALPLVDEVTKKKKKRRAAEEAAEPTKIASNATSPEEVSPKKKKKCKETAAELMEKTSKKSKKKQNTTA